MKVISFVNMKGGVGKTTLCVNVAYALAYVHKKKVLVVDADPQFNATQCLVSDDDYIDHVDDDNKGTLREIFVPQVRVIDCYILMAESADTHVGPSTRVRNTSKKERQIHLFDLLRDRRLFPLNSDLVSFAARIVPGMERNRLSKISKSEIAARIIDYLDTLEPDRRKRLEESMREALRSPRKKMPAEQKESFFTKWERIIKRIEL